MVNIDQTAQVKGDLGCYTAQSNSDNGYWCRSNFTINRHVAQSKKVYPYSKAF